MSHTLSKVNLGNNALAAILIQNYVQGGETFTLAALAAQFDQFILASGAVTGTVE